MKETIEAIKQRIETEFYLRLESLKCCYEQQTTEIDYDTNRINFNNSPEEIRTGIEFLIRGFYYENALPGKKLLQTRREALQLQKKVLGKQLPPSSNPIVYIHDQETVIYPDAQSIQNSEDPNIRSILNKPEFSHHNALVILNNETLLAEPYRQVAIAYNRQASRQDPIIRALSLFIQKQLEGTLKAAIENALPFTLSIPPQVIAVYQKLEQIAEETGPLTALRTILVYPEDPPVEYLQRILTELKQTPTMAFSDPKKEVIYSLDNSHQDNITNLPQLRIITMTQTGFTQKLFEGNIDLNDAFLEAIHIYGEAFNQTRDQFTRLTFTADQINSLRTKAEQLIISAENNLQQGISLERQLQQKGLSETETVRAHQERNRAYLTSLYQAYNALRHIVFTQRYTNKPTERATTSQIISAPSSNLETILGACYQTLKELAQNPARIRTKPLYNTIQQIRGFIREKTAQTPPTTSKTAEKSQFDPSKLIKAQK